MWRLSHGLKAPSLSSRAHFARLAATVPGFRWFIAFVLFAAALLNYIDRNVLGLLATSFQHDLQLSNLGNASGMNFFLAAYTLANLLSGRVAERRLELR